MPSTGPSATACALAILLAACGSAFADVSFTPLGDLPGGSFFSTATAISSDGSIVSGGSATGGSSSMPITWSQGTGMVALGVFPATGAYGFANGISRDGRVVVGLSVAGSVVRPVKWVDGSGPIELEFVGAARAMGVSADGSVIVGSEDLGLPEAVLWRGDEPTRYLGYLPGHTESRAMSVSPDGSLVVGWGEGPGIRRSAFRWTEAEGMQPFDPPEATITMGVPNAFSEDGTTIVGRTKTTLVASRWTEETGTVALPHLAGVITVREAFAVSADGSTIGGRGSTDSGDRGFIWTLSGGTELALDFFARHGLNLSGWQITVIAGISADGKTFTGTGVHDGVTEAFVAVIPAPPVIAPFAVFACRRRRQ